MSSGKLRPFCLGLNVLIYWDLNKMGDTCRRNFQMQVLELKAWSLFVREELIENKSAFSQVMAWHPTHDKP